MGIETGGLPLTGGEVLPLAGAATALLVVGTGLLVASRRRGASELS